MRPNTEHPNRYSYSSDHLNSNYSDNSQGQTGSGSQSSNRYSNRSSNRSDGGFNWNFVNDPAGVGDASHRTDLADLADRTDRTNPMHHMHRNDARSQVPNMQSRVPGYSNSSNNLSWQTQPNSNSEAGAGKRPLEGSGEVEVVKRARVVKPVEDQLDEGRALLTSLIDRGNVAEMARMLSMRPELLNHRSRPPSDMTPLQEATFKKQKDMVALLLKRGATWLPNLWHQTPLLVAAEYGWEDVLQLLKTGAVRLLESVDAEKNSMLESALASGYLKAFVRLIDEGADVNYAAPGCQSILGRYLQTYVKAINPAVLDKLLEKGATFNATDQQDASWYTCVLPELIENIRPDQVLRLTLPEAILKRDIKFLQMDVNHNDFSSQINVDLLKFRQFLFSSAHNSIPPFSTAFPAGESRKLFSYINNVLMKMLSQKGASTSEFYGVLISWGLSGLIAVRLERTLAGTAGTLVRMLGDSPEVKHQQYQLLAMAFIFAMDDPELNQPFSGKNLPVRTELIMNQLARQQRDHIVKQSTDMVKKMPQALLGLSRQFSMDMLSSEDVDTEALLRSLQSAAGLTRENASRLIRVVEGVLAAKQLNPDIKAKFEGSAVSEEERLKILSRLFIQSLRLESERTDMPAWAALPSLESQRPDIVRLYDQMCASQWGLICKTFGV